MCLLFGHILALMKVTLNRKISNVKIVEKLFQQPRVTPTKHDKTITLPNMKCMAENKRETKKRPSASTKQLFPRQTSTNFSQYATKKKWTDEKYFPAFMPQKKI